MESCVVILGKARRRALSVFVRSGSRLRLAILPLLIVIVSASAQVTHNLDIIWQKGQPPGMHWFGMALAAGDFNGDGYSDIVVLSDSPPASVNKALVFFGGPHFDTIPDLLIRGTFLSVDAPDFNGDGFADLVLGNQGDAAAYVFLGGSPMDTVRDYKLRGWPGSESFGHSLAHGDVNGDGCDDLVVGALWTGYGGRVGIFYGGYAPDTFPRITLAGRHYQEQFGASVASGGDFNRDGCDDVVVGANQYGNTCEGRIYVFLGGNPMDTLSYLTLAGESPWSGLGSCVDFLTGDDDFARVVAGASGWESARGKVYVLYGGAHPDSIPDVVMCGPRANAYFGSGTSSGGRVDGGRFDALLAGMTDEPNGYYGTMDLWIGQKYLDTIPSAWLEGTEMVNGVGYDQTSAGDVDGDGRDEILLSNYQCMNADPTVWVCRYTGTGVGDAATGRAALRPIRAAPNPCCDGAALRWSAGSPGAEYITIRNALGARVRVLASKHGYDAPKSEERQAFWDLRDERGEPVASGVYFAALPARDQEPVAATRIVVAR